MLCLQPFQCTIFALFCLSWYLCLLSLLVGRVCVSFYVGAPETASNSPYSKKSKEAMFKCSCLRDLGRDISVKSLRDIFVTVSFFPFLLYS